MRFSLKLGIALAVLPASIEAVELREDLPFVKGRYATTDQCMQLQGWEKEGRQRSLNTSAWHLTNTGFSDGWEESCSFHSVIVRGDTSPATATATAICGAGAEFVLTNFYFEKSDSPKELPDIYVYQQGLDTSENRQGITYSSCPVMKAKQ